MSRIAMQNLAEQIRKENKNVMLVALEPVSRDKEIDITSILNSGLGNEKALGDDGTIDSTIR